MACQPTQWKHKWYVVICSASCRTILCLPALAVALDFAHRLNFISCCLSPHQHARGLMTPELQAALLEVTRQSVLEMKEGEHSDLQEMRNMQRGGQITQDEFVKSKNAKVRQIEQAKQRQRQLLEKALLDAKRRQSQTGCTSQQMDEVLAALKDVSQRLAKLENRP